MSDDGDDVSILKRRVSRRQVLAVSLAGGATLLGAAEALDSDGTDGDLYGGKMALVEEYKLASSERTLYQGPNSAKGAISGQNGDRYIATDVGVNFHWDGGWVKESIGSSSVPVPSVTTDKASIEGKRYGPDVTVTEPGVYSPEERFGDTDTQRYTSRPLQQGAQTLGRTLYEDYTTSNPSTGGSWSTIAERIISPLVHYPGSIPRIEVWAKVSNDTDNETTDIRVQVPSNARNFAQVQFRVEQSTIGIAYKEQYLADFQNESGTSAKKAFPKLKIENRTTGASTGTIEMLRVSMMVEGR